MALVRGLSYFTFILFVNIPVIISGIIYLHNKDLYDEPAKYAISPQRMNQIRSWPAPYNPQNLALLLMGINASIGVPIILAFSALIYEQLHIPIRKAAHLSVFYPFIQLIVILALKWKFCCSLKRRDLVLGGYGLSIMAFFLLLITLEYGTLETDPAAKAAASAAWFTVLAVSISIPCNTALCYITEQFPDRKSQIRGTSKARMFLWFLSAISSGTFLPILRATSIFFALLPYFVISIIIFVLLIFAVPEEVEESHESIVMDYGTSKLLE
uniref:Uncharacterized protein n=1 Tax=Acrobeloides nanus TaxID=290746 RepID=A0A914DGT0_9BILA